MKKSLVLLLLLGLISASFVFVNPAKADIAYGYQFIAQSSNIITLLPGENRTLWVEVKNTGSAVWTSNIVHLGTSGHLDRDSAFQTNDWLSNNRTVSFDSGYTLKGTVPPTYHTRFTFTVRAPLTPGSYVEHFAPVADGIAWMTGSDIYWGITVVGQKNAQPVVNPQPLVEKGDQNAPIYPKVISINPKDGEINVATNIKMILELEAPASGFNLSFELLPTGTFKYSTSGDATEILLSRDQPLLEDTNYILNFYAEQKGNTGSKKLIFSSGFKTVLPPSPPHPIPPTPIDASYLYQAPVSYKVLLNVPQFYQLPLSCEATSLHMALSYHGKSPGQATLVGQIGVDSTPIQKNGANIITWGDPNQAFVGNIYGSQYGDGYGVYWDAVARVGSLYGQSTAFMGWSLSQILNEVQKGNPVIIWGSLTGGVDSWMTPAGKEIYAVHGEHARVVKGFDGTLENPSVIYINDPYYGSLAQSASAFSAFTAWFNNSGVVVY